METNATQAKVAFIDAAAREARRLMDAGRMYDAYVLACNTLSPITGRVCTASFDFLQMLQSQNEQTMKDWGK